MIIKPYWHYAGKVFSFLSDIFIIAKQDLQMDCVTLKLIQGLRRC